MHIWRNTRDKKKIYRTHAEPHQAAVSYVSQCMLVDLQCFRCMYGALLAPKVKNRNKQQTTTSTTGLNSNSNSSSSSWYTRRTRNVCLWIRMHTLCWLEMLDMLYLRHSFVFVNVALVCFLFCFWISYTFKIRFFARLLV